MMMKTERFEMRLDHETLQSVDTWRNDQPDRPSRAEAMRRLVDAGLSVSEKEAISISDGEKLILMMLCDRYIHQEVNGEVDPEFVNEAISCGHYWALDWKYDLFHGHVDSPRVVSEVVAVLDMWSFVESSYEKLSTNDQERIRSEADPFDEKFPGFAGNDEAYHLAIANFMINNLGRFGRFKGRNLNSHFPYIIDYQRMLIVFNPIPMRARGALSASQIIDLLNAQRPPEWKKGEQPLGLSKMRELAAAARDVGRDPVKTNFTDQDRSIVRSFIESRKQLGTPRRESFLGLCGLLGRRLDASHWHRLDTVDKVSNPHFLVGGHPVREDREQTDWTNKCFGLAEVEPEVFVVGLNRIFFDHAAMAHLLSSDE